MYIPWQQVGAGIRRCSALPALIEMKEDKMTCVRTASFLRDDLKRSKFWIMMDM